MQIRYVNLPTSWSSDTTYNIDIEFGTLSSTTFLQTTLELTASNFRFYDYSVVSPIGLVELIKNEPPTGGQLTGFSVAFAGAPVATAKWKVRIKARTNGSFGTGNTITAKVTAGDGSPFGSDSGSVTKSVDFTKEGFTSAPPTPQKLKAVSAGAIANKLTWPPVAQAQTITIQRATDDAFTTDVEDWDVGGSDVAYLDIESAGDSTALDPSTEYFYRIKASNPFLPDGTDWSNTDSATTTATAANPDAPEGIKAARRSGSSGSSQIKVSWNSIPKLTVSTNEGKAVLTPSYQVKVGTAQIGPFTDFGIPTTETSLTVDRLLANTTYYFVVEASYLESPDSLSGNSDVANATTRTSSGVPVAVTDFEAEEDTLLVVALAWTDTNDGHCKYVIGRGTSAGGPFTTIATLGEGSTSYSDSDGLAGSTTYYYIIYGQNEFGNGPSSTDSAATGGVPPVPDVPVGLTATPLNDSQIALYWTASTGEPATLYEVKRGTAMGGPYTTIATIAASATPRFEDINLTPSTTFYYVVAAKNLGGSSSNSSEASATTRPRSVTVVTQSGLSFDPLARVMIRQIGGRACYFSDRDRPVIWINGCWFPMGLKRQLEAPTVSAAAGGTLEYADETYTIYTKMKRSRGITRSDNSPGAEVTLTAGNQKIRVTPTLTGNSPDTVACRDVGFDISGNEISGADFVEIYIKSSGSAADYLLETIAVDDPIWDSPGYYETPDLTQRDLFSGSRRPMEHLGENSLPPACSVIVPFGTRMIAFGETNIAPTTAEITAGATLTISQGDTSFTVSGYTLTDAIIYHELWINGAPTQWYVYDVDPDNDTAYIRHPDPTRDAAGWEGNGGGFPQFKFAATPSRMYTSAFYSGEALGLPTFSPETYPPMCTFDRELFPDDNTDPVAAIVLNDALYIGKPTRWVVARGGNEVDYPRLQFESLSTESGINSPKTLVKDSQDRAYYLGDTGVFRVTASGVEKLNVYTGNQRLFEQVFDIASVPDANAVWFSREDWYVCASLDLIGNSGRRDGFVLDLKNMVIMPFSLPIQITWMEQVKNSDGEFQIEFSEKNGRTGVLFKKGLSVDGIDFGIPTPSPFSTSIKAYLKTGILDTTNRVGIRSFQAHARVSGGPVRMMFSSIRKDRMDDPNTEQIVEALQFDTDDKRNNFLMANHSFPNLIGRLDVELPTNPADTKFELRDLPMEVITRGPVE